MRVMILGGDGFCGWPTALGLSAAGHSIHIVDDLSRRKIDQELGTNSLTPLASIETRLKVWRDISGANITFTNSTVGQNPRILRRNLQSFAPDAIVHFAEQRSAPYSMAGAEQKRYTISRNILSTTDLLNCVLESQSNTHIIHLGTMGVYGYSQDWGPIPDGYVEVKRTDHEGPSRRIVFPTDPGSVYHLTKSMDHLMFQFYAKNDGLKITDLHQGVVWGTQTTETKLDPRLNNRFDYDSVYGTVLNRFLVQAAINHPLTVYGTGGQTRAFIHISDTVRCIELAIQNPPEVEGAVRVMNQVAETRSVGELAALVASKCGSDVTHVQNPRSESASNSLDVKIEAFRSLGFQPKLLTDHLMDEIQTTVLSQSHRIDPAHILPTIAWNRQIANSNLSKVSH